MPEYEPDPIVIRAASVRAEQLSDDQYASHLRLEIAERCAATTGDLSVSYRPDLLMGTLLAAPNHATIQVYGILLNFSEVDPVLPSDKMVLAMAHKCFLRVEKLLMLPYERKTLLRAGESCEETLLRPAESARECNMEQLLRPAEDDPTMRPNSARKS